MTATTQTTTCPIETLRRRHQSVLSVFHKTEKDGDQDELLAVQDMASFDRATSISGIAFQLAVAGGETDILLSSEVTEARREEYLRRIDRLVTAAFESLVEIHGLTRKEYGESWIIKDAA